MSTRQKIQNVPRWPTVTVTTSLPNVSGSPTQSSQLEVGDECYVSGTVNTLYVCTSATLGAATWVAQVGAAGQLEPVGAQVYYSPSNPNPAPGVLTTWAQVQAVLDTAGPALQKTVHIDSSNVGYVVTIPAGAYANWDLLTIIGDDCLVRLAQGVTLATFYSLTLEHLQLETSATSGPSPITSASYIYLGEQATLQDSTSGGTVPLIDLTTSACILTMDPGSLLFMYGTTVPVIRVSGQALYVNQRGNAGVMTRAIGSTNPASSLILYVSDESAARVPPLTNTDHPLWTAGTVTYNRNAAASEVKVTPTGGVAATTVQAALAELDSEKAAVSGGQLGGTGAAPDVRGLRETSGPTLLTMGAVADGQVLKRSGSTIVGVGGGPYELLWKWNQTDLTEFDQVGDGSHAYTVTTWGARNSTDDPTPAIRMDSPATSGGFSALLVKTALLPAFTNPTKLLIVARMQNSTTLGTQDPLLIPYYESTTYFTALARKTTGASPPQYLWCLREGSTTYTDKTSVSFPSPLANNVDGAFFSAEILLSPASGSQKPWIAVQQNRFLPLWFAQTILQARASYAAGWTGLGSYAPRIGFGVRTYGTAAANGNCVADIAIYKVNI